MGICLVYVTHENKEKAKLIVNTIVEQRLAACANIFPIESAYWWQEVIQNDQEVVTIFKTTDDLWIPLRDRIEEIHPYEVPCIIKIDVEVNESYQKWIEESTGQP